MFTFRRLSIAKATAACAITAATLLTPLQVVKAETLSMLSGFSPTFAWYREIGPKFIEMVEQESQGDLNISFNGPDTVPTFEQFEPVQAGVFDLLFTHPAYHSGTTAVGLSIDAIGVDPQQRRANGIIDYIDEHYQKLGMKLISAPSTGTKGFRYYLREPVTAEPGLNGRKVRGTVSYHGMIRALGGSPVNMPVSEIYTALQRGTIDGAAWGLTGASDLKWHEVIDYMADPVFGQVGVMIFMNLDRWNSLNSETQQMLESVGRKLELESLAHFDELQKQELTTLTANGMKLTQFSPAEAEQLETLWSEGVWKVADEISGEDANGLRTLAQAHGMSK